MQDDVAGLTNSRPNDSGAGGAAIPVPAEPWRPKFNPWLIAVVVSMAAFMEVLDTRREHPPFRHQLLRLARFLF
jgi:hypothetical protein